MDRLDDGSLDGFADGWAAALARQFARGLWRIKAFDDGCVRGESVRDSGALSWDPRWGREGPDDFDRADGPDGADVLRGMARRCCVMSPFLLTSAGASVVDFGARCAVWRVWVDWPPASATAIQIFA
ncbi:MAG: hypothetical protein ACK4IT_04750 [Thioalkalivibrionaceae bacterium]